MNDYWLTTEEWEVVEAQGWNTDSIASVLGSWEPTQGTRLDHFKAVAALENEVNDDD